jgi:hypothetical protein
MVGLHLDWAVGPHDFAPEPRADDPPPGWIAGYENRDGSRRPVPIPSGHDPWIVVEGGELVVYPLGRPRREWDNAVRRDPCAYCGAWCWASSGHNFATSMTLDHIDPKSRGWTGEVNNTAAACRRCNSVKGDTPMLLFLLGRSNTPERP